MSVIITYYGADRIVQFSHSIFERVLLRFDTLERMGPDEYSKLMNGKFTTTFVLNRIENRTMIFELNEGGFRIGGEFYTGSLRIKVSRKNREDIYFPTKQGYIVIQTGQDSLKPFLHELPLE